MGVTKAEVMPGRSCRGESYGDPGVVCKNFSPARWEILRPAPPNLLWRRELCVWWLTEGGRSGRKMGGREWGVGSWAEEEQGESEREGSQEQVEGR